LLHEPVLKEEVLRLLEISPGNCVIDCTAGFGGHTEALWEQIKPNGKVVAIYCDQTAIEHCKYKFKDRNPEVICVHENFRYLDRICKEADIKEVNAILIDCGVSSVQLDEATRGFSMQRAGDLDMRMDVRNKLKLDDIISQMSEAELADTIYAYGQERYSRRIAKAIKREFDTKGIQDTMRLAEIIRYSVPRHYRWGRIHPATRTFQALRIQVNDELKALEEGVASGMHLLSDHGRMAVISFHSLEDGMIKRAFLKAEKDGLGIRVTKKPMIPSDEEAERNPRSRSAKLRVFERHL